ncbi:hypothetical protein [Carnobacterium sp.]|uniref:hypothetical protein n=1 Tax=Carnobacterium sp. TaxID=48221 RepID=UPI00388E6956
MSIKLAIQTILNFMALDLFLNPIVNAIIPISGLGVFLSFLYWGILFAFSYKLAIYLRK